MIYVSQEADLHKSQEALAIARQEYMQARATWEKKAILHQKQSLAFSLQKVMILSKVDEIMYLGYLHHKVDINKFQLLDPGHYFDYKHTDKNIDYIHGLDLKKANNTPFKSQVDLFSRYEKRLNTLYPEFSPLLDQLHQVFNYSIEKHYPYLFDKKQIPSPIMVLQGQPLTSDIRVIMKALLEQEDYDNWHRVYEKDKLNNSVVALSNDDPKSQSKNKI